MSFYITAGQLTVYPPSSVSGVMTTLKIISIDSNATLNLIKILKGTRGGIRTSLMSIETLLSGALNHIDTCHLLSPRASPAIPIPLYSPASPASRKNPCQKILYFVYC